MPHEDVQAVPGAAAYTSVPWFKTMNFCRLMLSKVELTFAAECMFVGKATLEAVPLPICTKMNVISIPDWRFMVCSVIAARAVFQTTCCTLPMVMSSVKVPVPETGIKLMPNLSPLGNVGTLVEVA